MKHLLAVQVVHEGQGSPEKLHHHISRQIISSLAFLEDDKVVHSFPLVLSGPQACAKNND